MKNKIIKHTGIVNKISPNDIEVMISVSSACASCHAKGACTSADSSDRKIIVKNDNSSYQVGDCVNIVGTQSMGMSAVFYAYVLPFIMVFASLLMLTEITSIGEIKAGLVALAILPPYYCGLFIFRKKLEKKYTFTIH